ncbi:MAG TPA: class I SAM-dependent methyltransferase [Puia sp.]|nr:class I SAM-dependent methyltransferase [Puia sp.]
MQSTTILREYNPSQSLTGRFLSRIMPELNKSISDWILDILEIRPYQYILEIGYASGYTLQEIARRLKVGFLAGIDESILNYERAYQRNKKLIIDQLLQLHIGPSHDLAYPHHYFNSILVNYHAQPKFDSRSSLIQLAELLKPGGRLVTSFQASCSMKDEEILRISDRMQEDLDQAGLRNIVRTGRETMTGSFLAFSANKE